MKRSLSILLLLLFLAGCAGPAAGSPAHSTATEPTPSPSADPTSAGIVDEPPWFATFRVVDTYENGSMLLAENEGGTGEVYRLGAQEGLEIKDGQLINVYFETVMETYPAQFGGLSKVEIIDQPTNDRCGLYLQVLEDLWAVSAGLNENITELGLDLSGVRSLSPAERSALIWRFGELHDVGVIEATLEEIREAGHLTLSEGFETEDGREPSLAAYYWEKGCFFTIVEDEEAVWNLPMLAEGEEPPSRIAFNAHKWKSGLGAYFFGDCVGTRQSDGSWTYTVGYEAIS